MNAVDRPSQTLKDRIILQLQFFLKSVLTAVLRFLKLSSSAFPQTTWIALAHHSREVPHHIVGGLILEKLKKFHRIIAREVVVLMVFC